VCTSFIYRDKERSCQCLCAFHCAASTTTTDYTKDTVLPKSYFLQTNLKNTVTSNLDEFVVAD
jgi:hypothetical protein